jgi:hypothetical protein
VAGEADQAVVDVGPLEVRIHGELEVRQSYWATDSAVTGKAAGSVPKCSVSTALNGDRSDSSARDTHSMNRW